jgi:hypothetical protein
MNMFIIMKVSRIAAASAIALTLSAGLGLVYVHGILSRAFPDATGVTAYERAYREREGRKSAAWSGVLVGLPGVVLGLMATAKGEPVLRGALFGSLSLSPLLVLLLIFPYTTAFALLIAPYCLVVGGLSGWIAACVTRQLLTSRSRPG